MKGVHCVPDFSLARFGHQLWAVLSPAGMTRNEAQLLPTRVRQMMDGMPHEDRVLLQNSNWTLCTHMAV